MTPKPVPTMSSLIALGLAVLAAGLAIYGVTPSAGVLVFPRHSLEGTQATLICISTFVLPIALGLIAASMGGRAIALASRSEGTIGGAGPGVFAILIGLFAAVLGCVSTFAGLIYPRMYG